MLLLVADLKRRVIIMVGTKTQRSPGSDSVRRDTVSDVDDDGVVVFFDVVVVLLMITVSYLLQNGLSLVY